jgi:hypothetical protein
MYGGVLRVCCGAVGVCELLFSASRRRRCDDSSFHLLKVASLESDNSAFMESLQKMKQLHSHGRYLLAFIGQP